MKNPTSAILLSALGTISIGMAQGSRPAPIVSPVVKPDRSVSFTLRAPNAQKVELSGQFMSGTRTMNKDENGLWTITVEPVEPNLYPYNFVVDGVGVADPSNPEIFPNEGFKASLVDIPGEAPSLHSIQDVPHGKLSYCYVKSKVLDTTRPLVVYTPPGYRDSGRSYPVLYLVSGTTDTEETWYRAGRVNFILDNLIARQKAEPMIVAMPYGNMMGGTPRPDTPEAAKMYQVFNDELLQTILPYVEENFRVSADRDKRAIAGFSRGGGQSLFTGFNNLDKFAYIGSYSAYLTPEVFDQYFPELSATPEETNRKIKLLWLGVGKSDFLYEPAITFNNLLTDRKIEHRELVTKGGHTWMNARHYLTETLQQFFK